jgi:hypothetical protein
MPAPMIVPVKVNVVAQNFLFIISPLIVSDIVFIRILEDWKLVKVLSPKSDSGLQYFNGSFKNEKG